MSVYFSEWLKRRMEERALGVRELARQTGMRASTISRVINEMRGPGPELCQKLAQALDIPETTVFVAAGLMSPASGEGEATLRELYEILQDLPIEEQRAIVEEARKRYRRVQGTETPATAPNH